MTRRHFWTVPDCVKFRVIFEDKETVVGVNDANQHRTLRKDTGKIFFSAQEALKSFVKDFIDKEVVPKKVCA
jgi:hypothetical protein